MSKGRKAHDWELDEERLDASPDDWMDTEAVESGVYVRVPDEIVELGRLLDILRARGANNGAGGLLDLVESSAPRHCRRAESLMVERMTLLGWGELLYEQGAGFDKKTLRSELEHFVDAVSAYDDEEIAILQDTLLTDIGVVD